LKELERFSGELVQEERRQEQAEEECLVRFVRTLRVHILKLKEEFVLVRNVMELWFSTQ
jgi:hypothetical protein